MLTREIADAIESTDADEIAAEANFAALDADFCSLWPSIRDGLELLRDTVFSGSGLGSRVVRWAINTIIRVVNGRCAA